VRGRFAASARSRDGLRPAAELPAEETVVRAGRRRPDGRVEPAIGPVGDGDRSDRRFRELCPNQTGFDHDHVDAKALHLEAKRVAERLDRMLRRVVPAAAGEGQAPAHRADVDDPPPALAPHAGEDELRQPGETEEVRLELAPCVLERDALDRAAEAVARVVDEGADGALRVFDLLDRGPHRALVGDVQAEQAAPRLLEAGHRLEPARARVHRPPASREPLGGRAADPGGAARDEDG
jgi:hypothetical protein